jgi:hypothetical protein
MAGVVRRAAADAGVTPADQAVVELALVYARRIDEGGDPNKLGPPLLAVLESLQMTPRSRAATSKGGAGHATRPRNPLDELRNRRAARERDTAAMDAAPS